MPSLTFLTFLIKERGGYGDGGVHRAKNHERLRDDYDFN